MELPIEIGQVLEEEVIDISHEGKAVIKYENFTIFTDRGIIGDRVKLKVLKLKKSFAIGETLEIVELSESRIKPKCRVALDCGGCQLQEMNYEEELNFKRELVRTNLVKFGGLKDLKIEETIGMDQPYRYRNNVQIPIGHRDGKVVIGHFEKKSHRIVDTKECFIQNEIADRIVDIFRNFVRENKLTSYNRATNKGLFKHIVIRTSSYNGDTMVILVTNDKKIPKLELLLEELGKLKEVKSVYQNMNFGRSKLTMTGENKLLLGQEKIIDKIGDREYEISPSSFFQVNTIQAEKLYGKIVEFADFKGHEVVIDLYSGIGTISLFIADKVDYVYGVESFKSSVDDAKKNAKNNGVDNASFFLGKSEEILPQLKTGGTKPELIIVDPPRSGCEEVVLENILELKPEKIIYVSCNPATLGRDLEILSSEGYKVKKVQPVDMFPQTVHVETVVLLEK